MAYFKPTLKLMGPLPGRRSALYYDMQFVCFILLHQHPDGTDGTDVILEIRAGWKSSVGRETTLASQVTCRNWKATHSSLEALLGQPLVNCVVATNRSKITTGCLPKHVCQPAQSRPLLNWNTDDSWRWNLSIFHQAMSFTPLEHIVTLFLNN